MNTEFQIPRGIVYVPRYVKQESDMEYGSVVTHENYNAKLNLNTTQGDYNTSILKLLFGEANPIRTPHIPYLDNIIINEHANTAGLIDAVNKRIDTNVDVINELSMDLGSAEQQITNIINGVIKVGKSITADKIDGIDTAGARKYYGTNSEGAAGFYRMPDSIYADDLSETTTVDGIYFTPRADSINETMFTEALRNKINRETITEYSDLLNKPYINNVELVGSLSLSTLGIQPAGNYLTEVPEEYITEAELNTALSDYTNTEDLVSTYATKFQQQTIAEALQNSIDGVANDRAKICINTFVGEPKNGDLLINV